jgi:hypothetical protein
MDVCEQAHQSDNSVPPYNTIFWVSQKLTDDLLLLCSLWLFRLFLRVSHDVPGGGKVLKHAEPMFSFLLAALLSSFSTWRVAFG